MDSNIWGPLAWNLMADIAYQADRAQDPRLIQYAVKFFHSLAFLLPCRFCRNGYRHFINAIKPEDAAMDRKLVEWIYSIHLLVNKKLKKEDRSISYNLFRRKMNCYIHAGSATHLLDFCAILALNYTPDPLRKRHTKQFYAVLGIITEYPLVSEIFSKKVLKDSDLVSSQTYQQWIYSVYQSYSKKLHLSILSFDLWRRKYENAISGQVEPLEMPFIDRNYLCVKNVKTGKKETLKCIKIQK